MQGKNINLTDFDPSTGEARQVNSVGKRVKNVSVTGFEVHNATGINIVLLGAEDSCIKQNTVVDGQRYGLLTTGSKNSQLTDNTVTGSSLHFIGICMADVTSPTIAFNSISQYNIALCVETNGADIQHNKVSNNCIGAFVDPGINGAILRHNDFTASNPACPTYPGFFGVAGVIVFGAVNTQVQHNSFNGIKGVQNPNLFDVGIAVLDFGPSLVSGSDIKRNDLSGNDFDIFVSTNGTGNAIRANTCTSGSPPQGAPYCF